MNDQDKDKEQLIAELHNVRQRAGGLAAQLARTQQAEASLRASEGKYRRLYQSLMDAFVSVDMTGRIQEFNDPYRQMLGYEPEELLARTYVDLTPERWHAFQAKIIQEQVLQRGYSDTYEKEYRRKDGTTFPVELRTYLIRDEHCRPAAMWAIMRDITERKRAEAELRNAKQQLEQRVQERTAELTGANERLQAEVGQRRQAEEKVAIFHRFVEAATQGFGMAHVDGQIIYVNPFLARLFGAQRPEDVIGNHVSAYYPSDYLLRRERRSFPPCAAMKPGKGNRGWFSLTAKCTRRSIPFFRSWTSTETCSVPPP